MRIRGSDEWLVIGFKAQRKKIKEKKKKKKMLGLDPSEEDERVRSVDDVIRL